MVTIGFTGHRPSKLGGYNNSSIKNINIRDKFKSLIIRRMKKFIDMGETHFRFVTGMALGLDTMAFLIVESLKRDFPYLNIEILCAIPFEQQYSTWTKTQVNNYFKMLNRADKVIYVDRLKKYKIKGMVEDLFYYEKMQARNEYMVDISDLILGVWDGTKGGTYNCVKYCYKIKVKCIILNPNTLKTKIYKGERAI